MFFQKVKNPFDFFLSKQQKVLGKTYEDGALVFQEGAIEKNMYIIQEGKLEVFRTDAKYGEIQLAILEQGEVVGVLAMFDDSLRSASVRSMGVSRLLTLDRRTLMRRVHEDPFLILSMFQQVAKRVHQMNADLVQSTSMYRELTREHLAATRSLGSLATFFRDPNTKAAYQRFEVLTVMIATQLKKVGKFAEEIDDTFISNLGMASTLHDIGKESIDREILEKKGTLTKEEWKELKSFGTIGSKILMKAAQQHQKAGFLNLAAEISEFHHEYFDGTGYHGLKWHTIPLSARIISVVSMYDALRSQRPYREAMSHESAVKVVQDSSGTHFDPDVVDAFRVVVHFD